MLKGGQVMQFEVKYLEPFVKCHNDKLKVKMYIDIEPNNLDGSITLSPRYKSLNIITEFGSISLHSKKEINGFIAILEFCSRKRDFLNMAFSVDNINGKTFNISFGEDNNQCSVLTIYSSSVEDPVESVSINSCDLKYVVSMLSNCVSNAWDSPIEDLIVNIVDSPVLFQNELKEKLQFIRKFGCKSGEESS